MSSGIFGVTRNPMYLGMALAYAGIAVLFDSLGALAMLAVVVAVIWTQVIAREEAYLYPAFGADYWLTRRRSGGGCDGCRCAAT